MTDKKSALEVELEKLEYSIAVLDVLRGETDKSRAEAEELIAKSGAPPEVKMFALSFFDCAASSIDGAIQAARLTLKTLRPAND